MWQNILIVIAFIAVALIIYRSIDKLIDPLLPFQQVRRPVKKKVIVMKDGSHTSGQAGSPGGNGETPNTGNTGPAAGTGEKPDRSSLPIGV